MAFQQLSQDVISCKKKSRHLCLDQYDLAGNRTRVYAVRGRRLNRLTTRPYLIYEAYTLKTTY